MVIEILIIHHPCTMRSICRSILLEAYQHCLLVHDTPTRELGPISNQLKVICLAHSLDV